MRGSGKTAIGKLLARKLNKNFVETDQLIVTDLGKPISDIVKEFGWNKFRNTESKIMQDLALTRTNDVIATGGGVVENAQNFNKFKSNDNLIIWLKCSIESIIKRIGTDNTRPKITNADTFEEDLRKVYRGRESLYQKYADTIISSEENVTTVVNNIFIKLKERNLI